MVALLLEEKADVKARNKYNETACDVVLGEGRTRRLKFR